MTKDEALKMALEALERYETKRQSDRFAELIAAIKAALAQPSGSVEQEPAKDWVASHDEICALLRQAHDALALTSYPLKRKWVGLTQDQVDDLAEDGVFLGSVYEITRAIEAKLKEKNHD